MHHIFEPGRLPRSYGIPADRVRMETSLPPVFGKEMDAVYVWGVLNT